jgi:hypothetical protein
MMQGFPKLHEMPGFFLGVLVAWVVIQTVANRFPALQQLEQGF